MWPYAAKITNWGDVKIKPGNSLNPLIDLKCLEYFNHQCTIYEKLDNILNMTINKSGGISSPTHHFTSLIIHIITQIT